MTIENKLLNYAHKQSSEWQKSILHARDTLPSKIITDAEILKLCTNCTTPQSLDVLTKLLYLEFKENPLGENGVTKYLKLVDESSFSLKEWNESLVFFDDYLSRNQRRSSFSKMLGFIQCCEQSPDNKNSKTRLVNLLKAMLDEFGYIG